MNKVATRVVIATVAGAFILGCAKRIGQPRALSDASRQRLSVEFVAVNVGSGLLCVQRTELPRWMGESLVAWCRSAQCSEAAHWPPGDFALEPQYQYDLWGQRYIADLGVEYMSGPYLPMDFLAFTDAIALANVVSIRLGYPSAYELRGTKYDDSGEYKSIQLRRTNERGFRLPTKAEWENLAPTDWHYRSKAFQRRHGNLYHDYWDAMAENRYMVGQYLKPVASYRSTRDGLYDVWGNAGEYGEPSDPSFARGEWFSESYDPKVCSIPVYGHHYLDPPSFGPPNKVLLCSYSTAMPTVWTGKGRNAAGSFRLVIEPDESGACPDLSVLSVP